MRIEIQSLESDDYHLIKMTETQKKIVDRSDEIQDGLHTIINQAQEQYPKSKAEYQDYVTAFLISRIAALEIALEERK